MIKSRRRYIIGKMSVKYLISVLFCFVLITSTAHAKKRSAYQANVAVVDVQLVLEKSIAVRGIKQAAEKISNDLQKEMSAKEIEFKKIEEGLIKKKGVITGQEFDKEVAIFNKEGAKAQSIMREKKIKLEKVYASAMDKVNDELFNIIEELSYEYDFNLATPSTHVLFSADSLNITDQVIDRLNKKLTKVNLQY